MITIESLLKFSDGVKILGLKEIVIEVTQKECDELQNSIRDYFFNGVGAVFNIIDYVPREIQDGETELKKYFKQFRSIAIGGITIHYKIKNK